MGIYELLFIGGLEVWALLTIIVGFVGAYEVWAALDARLAEAEESSIGVETPLLYSKALKVAVLCMVAGMGVLISGYSLGETANELVSWFNEYDDNENIEAYITEDRDFESPGTSAGWDIGLHIGTGVMGSLVLAAISLGGQIFAFVFTSFDDELECDFQEDKFGAEHFARAGEIFGKMHDRESCYEHIQEMFVIQDLNGDGII